MGDNPVQSGLGCICDIIVGIIILAILFFTFKYIGMGIAWLFNQYADLLHVH